MRSNSLLLCLEENQTSGLFGDKTGRAVRTPRAHAASSDKDMHLQTRRILKTSRDVYCGSESACDLSLLTLYAGKAAKSRRNLRQAGAFAAAFDRL
jgi:hypothetical protein